MEVSFIFTGVLVTLSVFTEVDSKSMCFYLWNLFLNVIGLVQSLSHVRLFATPLIAAHLPVHHQVPESTQTHVHRVSDAIQPSHPLSSPSPALNLSQYQGLS